MNPSRTAIPPGDAFVAVPLDELKEPLLPPPQKSTPTATKTSQTDNAVAATEAMVTGSWTVPLHRLKLLSFVTGSMVAVASQLLLSQLLWKPTHPDDAAAAETTESPKSTREVVVFSLLWSFFTCVMIFGSMAVFVQCVGRYCFQHRVLRRVGRKQATPDAPTTGDKPTNNDEDADWDGDMFQIEAHHIVGSLLSISLIWIVVDIIQSVAKHSGSQTWWILSIPTLHQNAVYFLISAAWYAAFVRCVLQKKQHDKKATTASNGSAGGLMSTYQMIAATLGLISGLCSQFLLSFVLWRDRMTTPIVENVVLFSVLWSLCSVVLTFFGCLSLRLLTLDETNRLTAERIFLRMESHFIFCSLIGICLAWILIDLIMDMREQIVPSILMLAVSLLAFCAIVACFPEDQCLVDLQQQQDDQMAAIQLTTTTAAPAPTKPRREVIQQV